MHKFAPNIVTVTPKQLMTLPLSVEWSRPCPDLCHSTMRAVSTTPIFNLCKAISCWRHFHCAPSMMIIRKRICFSTVLSCLLSPFNLQSVYTYNDLLWQIIKKYLRILRSNITFGVQSVNMSTSLMPIVKVLKKLSISYMRTYTTQPLESMIDTKPEHTLRSGIRFLSSAAPWIYVP